MFSCVPVLGLNWYDGDYNCWEGGPCYVHQAIDLGTLAAGETKTASMNLGATLFAYKGNVCVKRAVIVEEGQHVQISAADVRTFSVGEKVNAMWQGKRQLYPATVKAMNSYENSYDLDYEDGDSETRVPARLIRPLATAAPRDLIPTPLTTTSQAPPPTDVETGGEL